VRTKAIAALRQDLAECAKNKYAVAPWRNIATSLFAQSAGSGDRNVHGYRNESNPDGARRLLRPRNSPPGPLARAAGGAVREPVLGPTAGPYLVCAASVRTQRLKSELLRLSESLQPRLSRCPRLLPLAETFALARRDFLVYQCALLWR